MSITRRDFLQGALVASAMALTGPLLKAYAADGTAAQDMPGYYPPLLNGMRGSHPGSFESAHALRDGVGAPRGIDTRWAAGRHDRSGDPMSHHRGWWDWPAEPGLSWLNPIEN